MIALKAAAYSLCDAIDAMYRTCDPTAILNWSTTCGRIANEEIQNAVRRAALSCRKSSGLVIRCRRIGFAMHAPLGCQRAPKPRPGHRAEANLLRKRTLLCVLHRSVSGLTIVLLASPRPAA